jgi:hypothetical protein
MNTRKLASLLVAAALAVPALGTFAAQEFGRDSVHTQPGQPGPTTASKVVKSEIDRLGRDSLYVNRDTGPSKPSGKVGEGVMVKAGRA